MQQTAIIGTGTWGTAMATVCARASDQPVVLWGRNPQKVTTLTEQAQHPQLAEYPLPSNVHVTADPAELSNADLVLWAVPTQHSAAIADQLQSHIGAQTCIVSLSKGLEQSSQHRVTEILAERWPNAQLGALSGPSHAEEVMQQLPAALVLAGNDQTWSLVLERLSHPRLRLYSSDDLIGVELGGALKNVIAVAAGICDGLKLGDNAKAALVTRGVAEIRRLGRALGANDATFAGLAGIGDLLATCYSPYGRNRALGLAVASGVNPSTHLADQTMVAEGAWTCRAAVSLGKRHGVELPIASQVASVLWADMDVPTAIEELLTRSAKEEDA